jgi:hypothetical protein
MTDPTNEIFQLAIKFVNQTEKHLFLTGKAGTGKTTFLKYIKDNCFKRMIVLAPTGVAAINAGGVTIHSFFQLPFGPFVANHKTGWNETQHISNHSTLFKNIRFTLEKRKLIDELEMIVIDEVSMMRCDTLDAVDHVLRYFRKKPHLPFGGVQMIYIGDLYQLPPVIKNEEWNFLKEHYKSPFFFEAHAFRENIPVCIELKKIYRQSELRFINILNNIRNNQIQQEDIELLHTYYNPEFVPGDDDNYIVLTSHNAKADHINRRELEKLPGAAVAFEGTISGEFNDKTLPAEMKLQLKVGAHVMFLKNDKGEKRRYFNGKIGIVSKLENEKILVKFPGSDIEMEIEKETWRNIRYRLNEETNKPEEEEVGTFSQYPIRLAWAITIHKSQGLTFEKAIIDAGASFAAGQVYVALSRLTSLDGLVLYSKIRTDNISTDPMVVSFAQHHQKESELLLLLEQEQRIFANRMLLQSFDWLKMLQELQAFIKGYDKRKIPDKEDAVKWSGDILRIAITQSETAKKFSKQLKQILAETADGDYSRLKERINAAQAYFDKELAQLITLITTHKEIYAARKRAKKYNAELNDLINIAERKRKELKNAVAMAENILHIKEKDQSSGQIPGSQHISQSPGHPVAEEPLHQ